MTYPLSSAVSAGQPTAVSHYNNLRLDALYLGNLAADSITLAALMARYQTGLTVEYLATSRVRVPASATAPVLLMIDGVLCSAVANVDLAALGAPSGVAAWWYFFAVKAAGSTTFTLDSNTSPTEAATRRRIARCYWDGAAVTQLQTEDQFMFYDDFSLVPHQICNGRLTLETGVPVSITDQATKATLYFTPYNGNLVAVYSTGLGWIVRKFSELSITLVGTTASKPYDVFLYDNAGTLTLELLVWTNATTRATALAWQDGTLIKSGDRTRRYMGTIYVNGTGGQTDDTLLKRNVFNYYNRLPRKLKVIEGTDTWAYTTATWRSANNSTANRVETMIGVSESLVDLMVTVSSTNASAAAKLCGICIDNTNANDADLKTWNEIIGLNWSQSIYRGQPAAGFHFFQWTEYSYAVGTTTWQGDAGGTAQFQSGMVGEVMA